MNIFYINLEKQVLRRDAIEKLFLDINPQGWALRRFNAVNTEDVENSNILGSLSPAAKACFLSHRGVIEANLGDQQHICVLEDDATFSVETFGVIDAIVGSIQGDWDILYLDICVPTIRDMLFLYELKQKLNESNQQQLLNLQEVFYASAAAYIINGKSKKKVFDLLKKHDHLDVAVDIAYRSLVHQRALNAFVFFPFLSSLAKDSESSDIQEKKDFYTEVVWHSFRKLMWIGGSPEDCRKNLDILSKGEFTPEAEAFSIILKGFLSTDYQVK